MLLSARYRVTRVSGPNLLVQKTDTPRTVALVKSATPVVARLLGNTNMLLIVRYRAHFFSWGSISSLEEFYTLTPPKKNKFDENGNGNPDLLRAESAANVTPFLGSTYFFALSKVSKGVIPPSVPQRCRWRTVAALPRTIPRRRGPARASSPSRK